MPADRKAPGSSQPEDLVAVIDEFHAMWNTHNVDGILSFFTEDSVITLVRSPREPPVSYHGEAAIRTFVNTHLPGWDIYARSHYQINKERAMWMARVSAGWLRRMGIDWIEWKGEAVVRDGKIMTLVGTFTPESVAKIETAMGAREEEA